MRNFHRFASRYALVVGNKYIPVDCGFVDVVEHLATLRKQVPVSFTVGGVQCTVVSTIKTWHNHNGVEYLVLADDELWIRLDHVLSIGEFNVSDFDNSCSLPDSK